MSRLRRASLLLLAAFALLLLPRSAGAQELNRAGLVVVKGDGSVVSRCVEFADASLSGYDLIAESGIEFAVEPTAMGAIVCSLEGEGCGFPQESCFCQCTGSPCVYWSYWTLEDEGWRYSNRGATLGSVEEGDVQAWVWGPGTVERAAEPPAVTFAEICPAPAAVVETSAAEPTAAPATPGATSAATEPETNRSSRPWLWLAGAAALPVVLLLLLAGRRPHDP